MRPVFSETDLNERPFLVFWEVTRACALACRHCRAVAQPRPHPDELTHEEALRLIDQLAELRPPMLVLTGGDPVMRPDILELVRAASGKGLHVALSPAATARLLHTDFRALKEAGVQSMSLSLDGAHESTHDAFRGVPHTYERTLRAAEMAKEAGMHLQINTTITKSTLGEFDDFVELMKRMKPGMWSVFLLVPTGRAAIVIAMSKIRLKVVLKNLKPLLFIIILTALLNLFYGQGEPIAQFWIFKITKSGIQNAVFMVLRISLLVAGTFMLTYTTSPIALTDGLESLLSPLKRLHAPVHELSMMMSIALRFIPTLIEETDKIMSAQKARGADFESGNLLSRAKALVPILVPLFISAFRRADELATAMECRCYHGGEGRTKLSELHYQKRDYLAYLSGAALLAVMIVLRQLGL